MKYLKLFLLVLCVLNFSCFAQEQSENERMLAVQKISIIDRPAQMVGIGLTQLLNDDYYVGAFYLDENVQYDGTADFFFVEAARRMEFRFASSKSISARSFKRKLAENVRINNTRDAINAQKSQIARFMRFFKGTYKKGDVLSFDYHHTFGTRVILNGKTIGEVELSHGLYNLLVNIWVGERPPSSAFKLGIVGKNDIDYQIELQRKFISL
ncbi:chalcone isomerase family protein [Aliikangiella sp. IMCC44359]|uniref:chalcone isomerase family protein n=1 Tax=Aliikangiella sp. IMCC44359 TaxID=3459125 RepID=UPI00403B174A